MIDYTVPIRVQGLLIDRVKAIVKSLWPSDPFDYCADARGKFIYIQRQWPDWSYERLGRLTFLGDTENMEFAIFNYRSGKYDAKERGFPGAQYLDGTIEGAMKALLVAYPCQTISLDGVN